MVKPRTERIQPGVWRLRLPCPGRGCRTATPGRSSAGPGSSLFDTGVGGRGRLRMFDIALAQAGFGVEDVELVVCTHSHSDHYGLAASICEATGCELWMHPSWEHIRLLADDPEAALERRLEVARMSGVPLGGARALPRAQRQSGRPGSTRSTSPTATSSPGWRCETDLGAWQVLRDAWPRALARLPAPARAPAADLRRPPARPHRPLLRLRPHPRPGRRISAQPRGGRAARGRPLPARPRQTVPRPGGEDRRGPRARSTSCSTRSARNSPAGAEPTAFEIVEEIVGRENLGRADQRLRPADRPLLPRPPGGVGEVVRVPDSDPQRWRAGCRQRERLRSAFSSPRPPEAAVARAPARRAGADRAAVIGGGRGRRRLRAAEAPAPTSTTQTRSPFTPEKPKEPPKPSRRAEDGQLADVRPQPGAHPLPAGQGG